MTTFSLLVLPKKDNEWTIFRLKLIYAKRDKLLVAINLQWDMLSCFNKTSFHIQFIPRDEVVFGLCRLVLLLFITTLLSSCSTTSLLPRQQKIVVTPWSSFEEANKAFDLITPYQTKKNELEQLGFDPKVTPNIKILNYLDLIKRFMPNQSMYCLRNHYP